MSSGPSSSKVTSSAAPPPVTSPGIRIECVSRHPLETLAERLERCRVHQPAAGRVLASTSGQGASLILVFKPGPQPGSPFPPSP